MKTIRAAIYARVSTDDRGQDPLNQLLQLREFAQQQGWQVAGEYTDHASASNGDREGFRRLREDAARCRFDVVLFWSLDRLSREGTLKTLSYLRQFSDAGIKYRSYTEPYFDTLGIWGDAIIGVIATIAQQERIRISERTKAGLARVKAKGQRLGRPPVEFDMRRARKLLAKGESYRAVAAQLKISPALLWTKMRAERPA